MSSVALYRTLIVDAAHAALADSVVETYLELAARQHTPANFGVTFPEAMVYFAAHYIQRTPGLVSSVASVDVVGPVTSQRDGDLSRTYAAGSSSSGGGSGGSTDDDLRLTAYGMRYLQIRGSRSSSAPFGISIV